MRFNCRRPQKAFRTTVAAVELYYLRYVFYGTWYGLCPFVETDVPIKGFSVVSSRLLGKLFTSPTDRVTG